MLSFRRKAREYVLQILFQHDLTRGRQALDLESFWSERTVEAPVRQFADQLIEGVLKNLGDIDALIRKYAEHWSLERMAVVDRNVLRFAVFEIFYLPDVPAKVTINEAIEIIKKYGDEPSSAFINGILDRIVKEEARARPKREAIERELHAGHGSV